jgi:hypothetical protein
MTYSALKKHTALFLTAIVIALPVASWPTSSAYAESAASEIVPVEECDGVPMVGLWISGNALHDLHQAYQMERAKRERLEQAIQILEYADHLTVIAQDLNQAGVHWSWWLVWGSATFTAGMITGLTLSR